MKSIIIFLLSLFITVSVPSSADVLASNDQPYYYTYGFTDTSVDLAYTNYHDINIFCDNSDRYADVTACLDILPDKAIAVLKNKTVLVSSLPVNLLIRHEIIDDSLTLPSAFLFGNLDGLYGIYDEKYEQVGVQSTLEQDIFIVTFLHEYGHACVNESGIRQLTDIEVKQIVNMTNILSPLNNAEHINSPNEAIAEAFMFYILCPANLQSSCPTVYELLSNTFK